MQAKDLDMLRQGSTISVFVKEQGVFLTVIYQGVTKYPNLKSVAIDATVVGLGSVRINAKYDDDITIIDTNRHYDFGYVQAMQYAFNPAEVIWDFVRDIEGQDWIDENIKNDTDWIVKKGKMLIVLSDEQFEMLKDDEDD